MSEITPNPTLEVENETLDEQQPAPPTDSAADAPAPEAPPEPQSDTTEIETPPDDNMLLDVEAELAALEKMTKEDTEAIPDLGDDSEAEDQPEQEEQSRNDQSDGLGEDELAAALAEVEQLGSAPKKPTDDQNPEHQQSSNQDTKPKAKQTRFKIGKKTDEVKAENPAPQPSVPLCGLSVCKYVQRSLDIINRPFERLSDNIRAKIGFISIVTIFVSILISFVMPIAYPNRDAVVFLQERRAALDAPPPEEELEEEAEN